MNHSAVWQFKSPGELHVSVHCVFGCRSGGVEVKTVYSVYVCTLQVCVRLSVDRVASFTEWLRDGTSWEPVTLWHMTCNRLLLHKECSSPAVYLWELHRHRREYKTERERFRLIDWQKEVKFQESEPDKKAVSESEGVQEVTSSLTR